MAEPSLLVDRRDGVDWLTLNRPARLNAFDWALRDALLDAVERVRTNDARGLVLTGAGRGFCTGADTKDILESDADADIAERRRQLERTHGILLALASLGKPSVALVDGVAAGGGWSLALATDVVVATPRARFVSAFSAIGLVPDLGAMYYLPRRVGLAKAYEIFLSGRRLSAAEALAIGAVDYLVPERAVGPAVRRLFDGLGGPRG